MKTPQKPARNDAAVDLRSNAGVVRALRVSYADDRSLLTALAEGHPAAASTLWDRFAPLVRGLLRQSLGPRAEIEDLTQDVFLTVFRRARDIRENLRSFIVGVCVRVTRGELRRQRIRRWLHLSSDDSLPEVPVSEADHVARDGLLRLYAILDKLDSESRLAFVLRHTQGLEGSEIAAALGCSLATAKRRLAKAQERLLVHARKDPALMHLLDGSRASDPEVGGV
jgi:RNA polymerase sigma-70 factor (ECF subfamily)